MSVLSRTARPLLRASLNTASAQALKLSTPRLPVAKSITPTTAALVQAAYFHGKSSHDGTRRGPDARALIAASSLLGGVLLYEWEKRRNSDNELRWTAIPSVSASSLDENNNNNNNSKIFEKLFPPVKANTWELTPRPAPSPSRVADYGVNPNGLKFTLYQYQTCPFCCKARVFLDYYGISYDVVEVNSVKRTEIKWSKYPKVPVLVIEMPDGKTVQLNDSSQVRREKIYLLVGFLQ